MPRVGVAVGEHDDLGRPAGQVDRDVARDLELRLVHVRVARARRSCRRARRTRASRSPAARRAPRPRRCRAASAAAATSPAPSGGVQTTIRSTPATCAGHGAHDERRDEVARHVDADRVERHPAPLEHDAGLDLERDVGAAAAPRASGARGRRARAAPRAAASPARRARAPARRRRARAPTRARPSSPARLDLARRCVIAVIRSTGTSRIDDAPAASSCGQQPPDVGGGHERVHGDHPRLGERQHARRARADERADRVERRLAARSASGSGARAPRRRRAASPTSWRRVGALARADQHRLRREAATPSERRPFVRSVFPRRDEVDDRVGEPEPRRDLDRAGHVDELDRRPAAARASRRG